MQGSCRIENLSAIADNFLTLLLILMVWLLYHRQAVMHQENKELLGKAFEAVVPRSSWPPKDIKN